MIEIESNPMDGTFHRSHAGPKQIVINLLEANDQAMLATNIGKDELGGEAFDMIYYIKVMEHMPLDHHDDAVNVFSGSDRNGTKLIFGAATAGKVGVGHIGFRSQKRWIEIMERHNFIKNYEETGKATCTMQEYNHCVNTVVYYYQGE